MKRLLALALVLVAAGTVVVLGTGASEDDGAYRVRVVFDNAFTVIPGLDVKISGVRVGAVESLDVTEDQKAAVVLRIDDAGFQDFRTDAFCTIRPQGLIGEKFVECDPTLPRREGVAPPPELSVIRSGPGEGQRLLPVERTGRPVDIDLINDIMRLPYRERLGIIINEFGTAVAGRGADLRQAIRRANPGLQQTDRVLKILADQNEVLADLAVQSDTALAPLAAERDRLAGFLEGASTTAQVSARSRDALEQSLQRLPTFLREIQPTMQQLEALSDEAIPVISDIGDVAPQVSRFLTELGPFSAAATPALTSLGDAAVTGREALINSKGTIDQLGTLAKEAVPASKNLDELTASLEKTGGFEQVLSVLFYSATSANGFDDIGYYQRAWLGLGGCQNYETSPNAACASKIGGATANDPVAEPDADASTARNVATSTAAAPTADTAGPAAIKLPREITNPARPRSPERTAPTGPASATDTDTETESAQESVADYLLGDGG